MKVKMMKLGKIKPYENNPRKNEDAVQFVANSIKSFGFKQPIVVDKDMVIIAGHTRYLASQELGLEEVPVLIADDLNEEEVKAYRIADNATAENSWWDYMKLDDELAEIINFDLADFGLPDPDSVDIDSLFEEGGAETEKEPKTKTITCPHCGEVIDVDSHGDPI